MRHVRLIVDFDTNMTDEDIHRICADAFVQIEDPHDEVEGATASIHSTIEVDGVVTQQTPIVVNFSELGILRERLKQYGEARDRNVDPETRFVTLTDDEALTLLQALEAQ